MIFFQYGGGQLSSKVSADSIKLAAPGTVGNLSDYVSTEYIFDSIKYNKLQDMTNYRINSKIAKKLKVENSESKIQVRKQNGRIAYTPEEDLALMDFVNEHFTCYPIGGNALYKKAENEKVTTHTWQSMRDHFLKVLHPKTKGNKGNKNKNHDRWKENRKKPYITKKSKYLHVAHAKSSRMAEKYFMQSSYFISLDSRKSSS